MQSTKNLKEKIVDDLLKTGFPLEVSISNLLNNKQWTVISSPLYIDPDTRITRELDIFALKIYNDSSSDDVFLFSQLIIQCKKSSKPWVFFDNGGNEYFWLGYYSVKASKENFMTALCDKGEEIGFKNHRYKYIKLHKSFHTAFNNSNPSKDLYDGLITSCKALVYYKSQYAPRGKTAIFFTPIIVLDGTLWSATLNKDSKISLSQTNKLLVKFDYIFGEEKKPRNHEHQFIEIITKEHFNELLKEIEKDNNRLLNGWINFLKLPQ